MLMHMCLHVLATVTCLPLLASQQELHTQRPLHDEALIKYAR